MLTAFASCIIVFYHMSFQDHSYAVLILTYVFDIFHIVKMAMNFTTPYKNKIGEVVTNKKAIRKRFFNTSFRKHHYIHIICILDTYLLIVSTSIYSLLFLLNYLLLLHQEKIGYSICLS